MQVPKLDEAQIQERLKQVPAWELAENGNTTRQVLERTFQFTDFVQAMVFVNKIADAAEAIQHHPNIHIRYSRVTLTLTTDDSGGITEKDFAFAKESDRFAA